MKKILLYGIGSYKNRGVEAIVNSTINQMDKKYEITIANLYNSYNSKMYNNKVKKYIPHISANSKIEDTYTDDKNKLALIQKNLINEIDKNDICISCGGDNYCYKASHWLYTIDEAVKNKNKKLILWGASLYDEITELDLINDMNLFDVLYIRESISYDAIKPYVDERKLILGPDPAFSLKPKKIKLNEWYQDRKIIGLNLSPFTINATNEEAYPAIIELIKYILKETDYIISLIPHVVQKESNDMVIHKKLKKEFKNEDRVFLENDNYDCSELKYIISQCDLMIVSRTHASIAAYSSCVPTLVLGYSVKSKGIAKDLFGTYSNYVLSYEELTANSIIEKFNWLDNNKDKIKNRLQLIIPDIVKRAGNIFQEVIDKVAQNDTEIICDKEKCIGCGLCKNICKRDAITFEKDALGFIYPKIDSKKCINCGLCKKICPIVNKPKLKKITEKQCYACKSKNDSVRANSSSGGIFPLIAKNFIKKFNGIVYGATNDNNNIKHIRIDKEEDIIQIQGSKYAQSNIYNVLKDIENDIKNNKKIIFSGTPCQIGAVKKLAKEYNNIYYISVICRGVMSSDFALTVVKAHGYSDDYVVKYRGKEIICYEPTISISNKENKHSKKFSESDIMSAYLLNANLRDSCYNCNFKAENNVADIILGDYWGVANYHPEIYDKKGITAMIINSKKGNKLIKEVDLLDNVISVETEYSNIVDINPMLIRSTEKNIHSYMIRKYCNSDQILLFINNLTLDNEIKEREKRITALEEERINNYEIIKSLNDELSSIKNSKRWQTIDKIGNIIRRQ